MNVNITKNGNSIKSYVISYERQKRICTGVGILQLVVDRNYGAGFDPWDTIRIFENNQLAGTYFVSQIDDEEFASTITVYAQDASKRLVDYFIDQIYTIDYPVYNKEWIIAFLNEAGIEDIEFHTTSPGTLISNNTSLGLTSAYDQIMYLVQISGWYFHFDANNTCHIGKLETDLASPSATLNSNDVLEIRKYEHDKMFRNRVVVWGRGSGYYGNAIGVEAYKITPWNYDARDLRTIVIANHNIPSSGIAQKMANEALDYFDEISVEKHIIAVGAVNLDVGDVCRVQTKAWRGKGLVTTFGTSMSKEGLISNIILDEKCPRLFAYFDFGDYVYIGTVDSGVHRKHIKYGVSGWHNFNGGDLSGSGTGISDLFVRADLGTTVTFSGDGYYIYIADGEEVHWNAVVLDGLQAHDEESTPILLSDPNVKARACTIDRTSLDFRFLLDNWSGQNFKNYVDMFYHRFSAPFLFSGGAISGIAPSGMFLMSGLLLDSGTNQAWILSLTASGESSSGVDPFLYPIIFSGIDSISGGYSVVGFDLENDGLYDYASVQVGRPPIFYVNTTYGGAYYVTGINALTHQVINHIPVSISGIAINTSNPEQAWGHNIGNMLASRGTATGSGRITLLNNNFVNSTIPMVSGEYDFGRMMRTSVAGTFFATTYQSYNDLDYVSLASIPSGTLFSGNVNLQILNHALVDRPGFHEIARVLSPSTDIEIRNYTFGPAGWSFVSTNTLDAPSASNTPEDDYLWTDGSGTYGYLKRENIDSDTYNWLWHYGYKTDGALTVLSLIPGGIDTPPNPDFVNNGIYYIKTVTGGTDPFGAGVGDPLEPTDLYIFNAYTRAVNTVRIFDGVPQALYDTRGTGGKVWYRLQVHPYAETYQTIGFVFILRIDPDSLVRSINLYPISGLSGKATIGEKIYTYESPATLDNHESESVTFSRTWSARVYTGYDRGNGTNPGSAINHVLNFGVYGAYLYPSIETSPGVLPWETGTGQNAITPISSPLFDNMTIYTASGQATVMYPPFVERGAPLYLNGHIVGSRPYTKPESNPISSFMVLRRDGSDFDIVAKGWLPFRLDASHPSPLVTANLYRFSFENYYIPQNGEVLKISQGHPLSGAFAPSGAILSSGVGFNIVDDYRYTTLESMSMSGFGQVILFTSSGGLWTVPMDFSTFNLYSGFTDAIGSGVILGSASMVETSNFAYPDQYIFLSTIVAQGDYRFYQKNPSGWFEDHTFSGWPNSEVTIIRLEDMV